MYGLSLVSKSNKWEATLESYVSRIDTRVDPSDSDFIKTKKEYFQREISVMRTLEDLPKLAVFFLSDYTVQETFLAFLLSFSCSFLYSFHLHM
jgi:hypothetical protein